MVKSNSNLKVFKANKLIEARYNLNITEQKLILYSASQVDNFGGNNFTLLKMNVSDFFEVTGLDKNSKNQKHVKKTAEGLMDKVLHIERPNGGWLMMNWVASCEYKPREGIIEFEFSQKMKPYLLELDDHYRGYSLREVMQLGSKYSIRLYELLIQWEYTHHKSLTIKVEELRKKMGVKDEEYPRFDRLEDRVIKSSVTELNNTSNIYVTYEKIKLGRRIHEIKFKFEMKKDENFKEIEGLKELKEIGYANHIEVIKEIFNDKNLAFSDLEIHKAFELTHKKLEKLIELNDFLDEAVYRYMLYYYECMKENAGIYAYNYYKNLLENDYAKIQQLYKFGRSPASIIYGQLL